MLSIGAIGSVVCAGNCVFVRGDANGDGGLSIADSTYITNYINDIVPPPENLDSADFDDDGDIDGDDSFRILCFLFPGPPCPSEPVPPPSPYPSAGCDCTPDDLVPCCSPMTGASDPEGLTINSVSVSKVSSSWGSEATATSGADAVQITTQNSADCDRGNTVALFNVEWSITDPHGIDASALDDGCVSIKTDLRVRADYAVSPLERVDCPEYKYNELGVSTSDIFADYYFTFKDPDGPDTVTINISQGFYAHVYYQYNLIEDYFFCEVNDVFLDGVEDNTTSLSNSGSESLSCWKLIKYTVKNVEFYYERYGNPRLTQSEYITWGTTGGYSLKLFDVKYDWCDS